MFSCCASSTEEKSVEPIVDAASAQQSEKDPRPLGTLEEAPAPAPAQASTQPVPKPEPSATQSPPPGEYKINIEKDKEDMPLGMDLETLGSMAMVLSINNGPIKKHNQAAPPEQVVSSGDFVVDVNGENGDTKALLEAFSKSKSLAIKLKRPLQFSISIDKGSYGTVGLELDYLSNGTSLLIKCVKAGPVQDWNNANKDSVVQPEDRIVSVNGTKGTAEALLDVCKGNKKLDLLLVRAL